MTVSKKKLYDAIQGDVSMLKSYRKSRDAALGRCDEAKAAYKVECEKVEAIEKNIMEKLGDGTHYVRFDNGVICRIQVWKMGERGVRQMNTEWDDPSNGD